MNKENSPVLDKILNGHKFKVNQKVDDGYSYHVEYPDEAFKSIYRIGQGQDNKLYFVATIDESESRGNILAIRAHALGKSGLIYMDCAYDLELIDG